jgi:hypothetical protein
MKKRIRRAVSLVFCAGVLLGCALYFMSRKPSDLPAIVDASGRQMNSAFTDLEADPRIAMLKLKTPISCKAVASSATVRSIQYSASNEGAVPRDLVYRSSDEPQVRRVQVETCYGAYMALELRSCTYVPGCSYWFAYAGGYNPLIGYYDKGPICNGRCENEGLCTNGFGGGGGGGGDNGSDPA